MIIIQSNGGQAHDYMCLPSSPLQGYRPVRFSSVKRLDSKIAQMAKEAYRQCRGTPTAMIMEAIIQ
jgi:hypothetical protein